MDPKEVKSYIDAIGAGLQPLADKIGKGGAWLFEQGMRNNYASAWSDAVFGGLFLTSLPIAIYTVSKRLKADPDVDSALTGIAIAGVFVAAILTIIGLGMVDSAFHRFIAPEWSTMKDIIDAVKPPKQ